MIIMVIISYVSTGAMKAQWVAELNSGAPDINIDAMRKVVDGYNAIAYINDFFYGDYIMLFLIVILAVFGISLAADGFINVSDGFGNFIVVRIGHGKYFNQLLAAQALFISTIIGVFFILLIIITIIIYPPAWGEEATSGLIVNPTGMGEYFIMWGIQLLQYIFLAVISVLIATSSCCLVSNKYLIRLAPLILTFVPMLLSMFLGNLSDIFLPFASVITMDEFLLINYSYRSTNSTVSDIIGLSITLPIILLILFICIYLRAKSVYRKSYL
jgi:hypothetical protein